jgi:hypothetical protein
VTISDLPPPPPPPLASRDRRLSRPPPASRPWGALLFHGAGALLTGAAVVVACFALGVLSFVTSSCSPETDSHSLPMLRIGLLVIGLGLAAVPGLWALVATAARYRWRPWVGVAAIVLVPAVGAAVATTQVARWCF